MPKPTDAELAIAVWGALIFSVFAVAILIFLLVKHRRRVHEARVLFKGGWYIYQTREYRYWGRAKPEWREFVWTIEMAEPSRFRSLGELLAVFRVHLPKGYLLVVEDTSGEVLETVHIAHEVGEYPLPSRLLTA